MVAPTQAEHSSWWTRDAGEFGRDAALGHLAVVCLAPGQRVQPAQPFGGIRSIWRWTPHGGMQWRVTVGRGLGWRWLRAGTPCARKWPAKALPVLVYLAR